MMCLIFNVTRIDGMSRASETTRFDTNAELKKTSARSGLPLLYSTETNREVMEYTATETMFAYPTKLVAIGI